MDKQNGKTEYSGVNRILKSQFIQSMWEKREEGTFAAFRDDWKWIFSYSRKYKKAIAFYVVLGILSSTLSLGSSVISKNIIDFIVGRQIGKLWLFALLMVFSSVFSLLFSSLVSRISLRISIGVNNDIQADVFQKIIGSDWLSLSRYPNGDLLSRFNNDVSVVAGNAVSWLPTLLIGLYNFLATFCVILHYDATMAFIALLSAPFLLLISRYIMRRTREYRARMLEINSKLMTFEAETFYNIDTIKSFGIADKYGRELGKWQDRCKEHNLDYNLFQIKSNAITTLISTGVTLVAFAYCLLRLWTGAIELSTLILFLQQRAALSSQFNSLIGIIPGMLTGAVSAHRIRELVELPRENTDPAVAEQLEQVAQDGLTVRMTGAQFSYEEDQHVITGSDFIARPGEIVALVGPSGEGKTTLLRLILGLVSPGKGEVVLSGSDGIAMNISADVRRFFSYVPQGNTMLAGTIAGNMRMVKEDATDGEIVEALKAACAWDFVRAMPQSINSPVGERGRGLSEGQAQRIAIARAVLRNAPVLLLDEATSALDVATERAVLRNIICSNPNRTCIVTTHRPSVLNMCQRVYRVMQTRVTELSEEESSRMAMDF